MIATSTLLVPAPSSATSSYYVPPIPTVKPDIPEYQHVTELGTRTLWVVCIVMLISSLVFTVLSWKVPVSKRLYYIITTLITLFASLSYFSMSTGSGVNYHKTVVTESHKHVDDTYHTIYRQVFYARYIDWCLTTPLLLLDLSLLAGLNGAQILMAVVADIIMIITGLFAAYGDEGTPQKWGWYAIACFAYLVVVWHLAVHGRAMAFSKSDKIGKFFVAIASFTAILWTAYPIVWGIADGARRVSVDAEIICYAVLDILAKPVFGTWLLYTHRAWPETNIELGGFWAHGLSSEGTIRVGDDDEGA